MLNRIYPANYYSFLGKRSNLVFRIKEWLDRKYFKKILRSISAPALRVLDVGGGSGWLLNLLKRADQRVSFTQVVDIDKNAGRLANANGHAYHEGTIESFQSKEKFELILMLNLVEHVADPFALLHKSAELLAPGGIILVKTPNTESYDARIFRNSYWGGLHCPRHWHIFSERSFRLLIKETPLQIEKLRFTQGAPFWAFSIIADLYRRKWIKVSAERPIIFHWLFAPLSAIFAVFDWLRKPFARTSQMFIVLRNRR